MVASLKFPSEFVDVQSAKAAAKVKVTNKRSYYILNKGARRASKDILAYLYWERPTTLYRRSTGYVEGFLKKHKEDKFTTEDFWTALRFLHSNRLIQLVEEDGEEPFILEPNFKKNLPLNHQVLHSKNYKHANPSSYPYRVEGEQK